MTDLSSLPTGTVLLDFTAPWCEPCKRVTPVLHELEREYGDRFKLVEIDVDVEQLVAQQLSVRSMPTLVFWRDGREVGRIVGARPKAFIAGALDRALGGDVAISGP